MKATQICSIEGCDRAKKTIGLCNAHYLRQWRRGTTDLLPVPSPAERLAAGLERKPNGCLEWTGKRLPKGYGVIYVDGKWIGTHRLAWSLAHPGEPLPPVVRHLVCDNPPCCDPEHLRSGTSAQNAADKSAHGRHHNQQKTHCPANHAYDEANTYIGPDGGRDCRICVKAANVRHRAKKVV